MSGKLSLAAAVALACVFGPSLVGTELAVAESAELAAAQTAVGSLIDPQAPGEELKEVVIVARRVEEPLEKVPLTVTAISTDQLETQSIFGGTDLQGLVPSMSVGISIFGATQQYSLRGIRDGVVEYLNEVPIDAILVDSQLWDLASVQAISGPQGTLFGRNSTGGTVLFVPQKLATTC
jgi:iron complex outermembrane receptor protein